MKTKCACCGNIFPESKMDFLNVDWEGLSHSDIVSIICKGRIHEEVKSNRIGRMTVLELQEELEKTIPEKMYFEIKDYNPSEGGRAEISNIDFVKLHSIDFQTLPEVLSKSIEWFKNYQP